MTTFRKANDVPAHNATPRTSRGELSACKTGIRNTIRRCIAGMRYPANPYLYGELTVVLKGNSQPAPQPQNGSCDRQQSHADERSAANPVDALHNATLSLAAGQHDHVGDGGALGVRRAGLAQKPDAEGKDGQACECCQRFQDGFHFEFGFGVVASCPNQASRSSRCLGERFEQLFEETCGPNDCPSSGRSVSRSGPMKSPTSCFPKSSAAQSARRSSGLRASVIPRLEQSWSSSRKSADGGVEGRA